MTGLVESLEKAVAKLYRKRIARRIYENSDRSVRYGPFKGMRLPARAHISSAPLALKMFGLYEPEVLAFLTGLEDRDTLVNLGAGDGYYSVGLIHAGTVRRALSFEIDAGGREAIRNNAREHGMEGSIGIFGPADRELATTLAREGVDPSRTIILSDIEGAEFEVIDDALVSAMKGACWAIEIHDFAVSDGAAKLEALQARLARHNGVEIVKAGPRDWRGIPELEALHDNARALVTSDGRKQLGRWLFAKPL